MQKTIRVKFVAKGSLFSNAPLWSRQLPDGVSWGHCHFIFDPDDTTYDWLVVYDDLPPQQSERFSQRIEKLACPRAQTIFITGEPTSIKTYGQDFLKQFAIILSSLEPWATPNTRTTKTILTQAGLRWFYGTPYSWKEDPSKIISYNALKVACSEKTFDFSTVCSNKRMKHTLHNQRVDFTDFIKSQIPTLEIFGHGVRTIDDKAEAITPYRYHLAIENHICQHHFTDKLSDPFLGFALPFYIGAPNAADYFPADSFIALDINKPQEAVNIIKTAIANNEYEKRLPSILEARRRILDEYNLFALIAKTIAEASPTTNQHKGEICARRAITRKTPLHALRFGIERGWMWTKNHLF